MGAGRRPGNERGSGGPTRHGPVSQQGPRRGLSQSGRTSTKAVRHAVHRHDARGHRRRLMSTAFDPRRGLVMVAAEIVGPTASAVVRLALDTGATSTLLND